MPPINSVDQKKLNTQRTVLLATDNKNSVLVEVVGNDTNHLAYSAYGHQSAQEDVVSQLGFNGELHEAKTGWYLLGNGYRAYNPRLMRFHSPDSWSPFGRGGLNAYMYCGGEPVRSSDPSGHMFGILDDFLKFTTNRVNKILSAAPTNAQASLRSVDRALSLRPTTVQTLIPSGAPPLGTPRTNLQTMMVSISNRMNETLSTVRINVAAVSNAVGDLRTHFQAGVQAGSNPIQAVTYGFDQQQLLNQLSGPSTAAATIRKAPAAQLPEYSRMADQNPPQPPAIIVTPPTPPPPQRARA
ncbi:RHS repeat-associated core domain-containing protein [Pseudomonas fluorescens]|uniref:RHS repeat-associated core domain-containing protein n=1 Tax=Pseudomonas fluorescens TaxID=294 RepID=A0A5E7EPU4_PSEFL|nr:RHS repeat-associated core domain-containing protein [Pseudomonas fluorescens]VVO28694.1 hypothetical protein PS833_04812 [Pseudomonas fluorescens]VVQ11972.1 hypothetical protein PS914_05295 [Pseudomonas fluorescens]